MFLKEYCIASKDLICSVVGLSKQYLDDCRLRAGLASGFPSGPTI